MNKKVWIPILAAVLLLAVLLVPWHFSKYDDGGTTVHRALAYQVVNWRCWDLTGVKVYPFPHSFKSLGQLRELENAKMEHKFTARVLECSGAWVLVEPLEGEPERNSCDRISFSTGTLEDIGVKVGAEVEITYNGQILESYPAQIHPVSWCLV